MPNKVGTIEAHEGTYVLRRGSIIKFAQIPSWHYQDGLFQFLGFRPGFRLGFRPVKLHF